GAEIELSFDDLLANGQAVGRCEGMVVFVFGPLPLERARVRITSVKAKYAVGEMLVITVESPHREKPFCPVFGECGGCQLQHLSYQAQLSWKRDAVRNALTRIGGFVEPNVAPAVGMKIPRSYRNKMSLVVDRSNGSTKLGFYKQRSHHVVAIDGCPIVLPQLDRYIPALQGAPADTRHIVVRAGQYTGQAVVSYTTARRSEAVRATSTSVESRLEGVTGLTNSFDLRGENAILGRSSVVLAGKAEIEERIGGLRYQVSPGSFFQVNSEIVERIFSFLKDKAAASRQIVDLYCGAGTFSIFFASQGARVIGIEESFTSIAEAHSNADLNGLQTQVRFHASRIEEAVQQDWARAAFMSSDTVFLDPPRKGTDGRTLRAIEAAGVANVWYLSCDPATLARDLKFLVSAGYKIQEVQPFDMFPQTGHIETLVILSRERSAALRETATKEYADFAI
ncbi:MAG: 23S rRNA (uracil(1939)-C(5))-methyltransferase RlmD, partial [Candidatus Eremiobacteraeota bacterium]|nr:23S rRNA (uracil(1939)-C(5))-methyltransferase RlmD [Candidatus Eremiobacteraeota bacterium]